MERMRIGAIAMMALIFLCIVAGNVKSCEWGGESEEELEEVEICDVPDYDKEIQGEEPVDSIIEYEDTHHYVPPVIPSFVESLLLCGWYFPVHDSL